MEFHLENFILKAFLASALLAILMMVLALGLIYLFNYGTPLTIPLILIVAAVAFVLSASFFERYEVGSIMWSIRRRNLLHLQEQAGVGGALVRPGHLHDCGHDTSQLPQAQPGRDRILITKIITCL